MRVITGSSLTSGIFFLYPFFYLLGFYSATSLSSLHFLFRFSLCSSVYFFSYFPFSSFYLKFSLPLLYSPTFPPPPPSSPFSSFTQSPSFSSNSYSSLLAFSLTLLPFLPPTYVPLLYLLNLCSLIVLFRFLSPPSPPRLLLYSKFHILLLQFFFPFLSLFLDISKISLKTL